MESFRRNLELLKGLIGRGFFAPDYLLGLGWLGFTAVGYWLLCWLSLDIDAGIKILFGLRFAIEINDEILAWVLAGIAYKVGLIGYI